MQCRGDTKLSTLITLIPLSLTPRPRDQQGGWRGCCCCCCWPPGELFINIFLFLYQKHFQLLTGLAWCEEYPSLHNCDFLQYQFSIMQLSGSGHPSVRVDVDFIQAGSLMCCSVANYTLNISEIRQKTCNSQIIGLNKFSKYTVSILFHDKPQLNSKILPKTTVYLKIQRLSISVTFLCTSTSIKMTP